MLEAGRLRHRVDIEERLSAGSDEHGDPLFVWTVWRAGVPAEIVPVSGKEFLAGQGIVAQTIAKIRIRFRPGVLPTMRIVRWTDLTGSPPDSDIYNIEAILPDDDSGREYLWLMCSRGVNEG